VRLGPNVAGDFQMSHHASLDKLWRPNQSREGSSTLIRFRRCDAKWDASASPLGWHVPDPFCPIVLMVHAFTATLLTEIAD
jgi:hypothetical protein